MCCSPPPAGSSKLCPLNTATNGERGRIEKCQKGELRVGKTYPQVPTGADHVLGGVVDILALFGAAPQH